MPTDKTNMTNELLIAALFITGDPLLANAQALEAARSLCANANVKPRGLVVPSNDGPVGVRILAAPKGIKSKLRGPSSDVIVVDIP